MEKKIKNYTSEHIQKEFDNLTKDKKIEVLYEALDFMYLYNCSSRFLCIAMAMGYMNWEDKYDTYVKMKIIKCKNCDKKIVKRSDTHYKFCSIKCNNKYMNDYDLDDVNRQSERGWDGHKNSF